MSRLSGQADKGAIASSRTRGISHGPMALLGEHERAHDSRATMRRLIAYLRPQVGWFALVVCLCVAGTLANTVAPRILGDATNVVYAGVASERGIDLHALHVTLTQAALAYIAYSACAYLQRFVMARVTQSVAYRLRHDIEAKFNRLPLSYFDRRSTGEVLSRVTNDVDTVSSSLQEILTQLVQAGITFAGVLVMMLLISPVMTLIAAATLPLSLLATVGIAHQSQRLFRARQSTLGEMNGQIEEAYGGHGVIAAFGRQDDARERFADVSQRYYGYAWRAMFVTGFIRPAMSLIGNLGYVGACVVGGVFVAGGTLAPGDVQAFLQYMNRFTSPIKKLAAIMNTVQSTLAAAERAFELLDEPEEREAAGDGAEAPDDTAQCGERDGGEGVALAPGAAEAGEAADARMQGSRVEFEHVRFGYDPDVPVIDDLSLVAEPGQTVAIVGPTGAGKSTLMNLLLRYYEPCAGRILLDGRDIASMPRAALRRRVSVVPQDPWLFSGTIAENIAYGRQGATREDVERAAAIAHADHFIRTLPEGYETRVSEEAGNLSAGQRQLVTIARAVLSQADLLVLDEATSSIDSRTERLVQEAMGRLMAGRTSFVVAHRLSTIRDADLILVMRDGAIVEQGTHDQLLARGGFYAQLFEAQFAGIEG